MLTFKEDIKDTQIYLGLRKKSRLDRIKSGSGTEGIR